MRKIVWLAPAVVGLMLLSSCGRQEPTPRTIDAEPGSSEPTRTALHDRTTMSLDRTGAGSGESVPTGTPRLSYTYAYAISGTSAAITALVEKHEAACLAAGPAQCVVQSSRSISRSGERQSASLELRAARDWVTRFRSALAAEIKPAGARIETSSNRAEDLTHRIVDGEAQLASKIILRGRLKAMLSAPSAKLSDLTDIEEKLAKVQGSIDEIAAELTTAKEKVATSTLKLTYSEQTGPLGDGSGYRELQQAAANVGSTFASGLAFVISALAWIMPALVVICVVIIVGLRVQNRGKPAKSRPT